MRFCSSCFFHACAICGCVYARVCVHVFRQAGLGRFRQRDCVCVNVCMCALVCFLVVFCSVSRDTQSLVCHVTHNVLCVCALGVSLLCSLLCVDSVCCCLLLEYLIQICARGGRGTVEDKCYEIRRSEACLNQSDSLADGVKRDLSQCQKRPITVSKEADYLHKLLLVDHLV